MSHDEGRVARGGARGVLRWSTSSHRRRQLAERRGAYPRPGCPSSGSGSARRPARLAPLCRPPRARQRLPPPPRQRPRARRSQPRRLHRRSLPRRVAAVPGPPGRSTRGQGRPRSGRAAPSCLGRVPERPPPAPGRRHPGRNRTAARRFSGARRRRPTPPRFRPRRRGRCLDHRLRSPRQRQRREGARDRPALGSNAVRWARRHRRRGFRRARGRRGCGDEFASRSAAMV